MSFPNLIGVQSLEFIEPTFSALIDEAFTTIILAEEADGSCLVVDENDWPLSLVVRTKKGWKGANFILKPPPVEAVERFEELDGEIVKVTQERWIRATREYYSRKLMASTPPSMEDCSSSRAATVRSLLEEIWGDRAGSECLDCGCGSGIGASVLRSLGIALVAYDNDPSLLSLGLSKGRLLPEETMLIDAALARHYMRGTDLGLALMAGTINNFTSIIWKAILDELIDLTSETVITVETEQEADLVRMWALGKGRQVELRENGHDQFYDRWICVVRE